MEVRVPVIRSRPAGVPLGTVCFGIPWYSKIGLLTRTVLPSQPMTIMLRSVRPKSTAKNHQGKSEEQQHETHPCTLKRFCITNCIAAGALWYAERRAS